ncbi:DUF2280 domain-containing protein [Lelliottia wanjuensis]|nr:DUF2280 domain-containing protein [Lelliottia sp. V86_10]MDK9584393.1 DUF2280 domain-containing protein [Lelliottia sp. V86_10]
MAALKSEVRAYIVQMVACSDSPSQVIESIQKEFGMQPVRRNRVQSDVSHSQCR